MFSPDAAARPPQGTGTRNLRRRRRDGSESVQQQPERKRSKISDETFLPPDAAKANGNGAVVANGHAGGHSVKDAAETSAVVDMPVREKKRSSKGDGGVMLTKSPRYILKHVRNLPERLKSNTTKPFRACILPTTTYALALTHDRATIWDYNSLAAIPTQHSVKLSHPSKATDPLPLGSIVTTGPSSEVGLVVITPATGKIQFWENAESAESLGLFQQTRQGVEGSISLLGGESVVDLVHAEHAGFILVCSTGRLAQLTVRDSQGKPQVTVRFLPHSPQSGGQGLFGKFGSIFAGSGWRKDVAAVQCRLSSTKGQVEVMAATPSGEFTTWDVSWAGHQSFKGEVNAQHEIIAAARDVFGQDMSEYGQLAPRICDFALTAGSGKNRTEVSVRGEAIPTEVLALVSVSSGVQTNYALMELVLAGDSAKVARVINITAYTEPSSRPQPGGQSWTPRLLLPRPGHTAHIIFERAIVFASLARQEETPDTQLLTDSGDAFRPFQDAVHFRAGDTMRLVGCAAESTPGRNGSSSSVAFTQGCGIVRAITEESSDDEDRPESHKTSAATKIEQAVHASPTARSMLDFSRRPEIAYAEEEVEHAAVKVSQDILGANTDYIPEATATIDHLLELKATAVAKLADHLRQNYPPLSRRTKWTLLLHAERVATAQVLWKRHEHELKDTTRKCKPWILYLWRCVHENFKHVPDPTQGEQDVVRLFFTKDVEKLEVLPPWTYWAIVKMHKIEQTGEEIWLEMIQESVLVYTMTLQTAWNFREHNARRYGLDLEFKAGMPAPGSYSDTPSIWTSTYDMVKNGRQLGDFVLSEVLTRQSDPHAAEGRPIDLLRNNIVQSLPDLIRVILRCHIENIRRSEDDGTENGQQVATALKLAFEERGHPENEQGLTMETFWGPRKIGTRESLLMDLYNTGKQRSALTICEDLEDTRTLAQLIIGTVKSHRDVLATKNAPAAQRAESKRMLQCMDDTVAALFRRFGAAWAHEYFCRLCDARTPADVFRIMPDVARDAFVPWLAHNGQRARMRWINDVAPARRAFGPAARDLVQVAHTQETNAWAKKIELSIAQLALLAVDEQAEATTTAPMPPFREGDERDYRTPADLRRTAAAELAMVAAQDQLYAHVKHTIYGALDQASAVELVMQKFATDVADRAPSQPPPQPQPSRNALGKHGGKLPPPPPPPRRSRPAFHSLLAHDFEALLDHRVLDLPQLVDVLTLMDGAPSEEPADDIAPTRFLLAIKALAAQLTVADGWDAQMEPASTETTTAHALTNGADGGDDDEEARAKAARTAQNRTVREACGLLARLAWKRCYLRDDWPRLNGTRYRGDAQMRADLEATAVYQTVWRGLKEGLFADCPHVLPPPPTDLVGAGCDDELRRLRFIDNDDLRLPLVRANARDDEVLQHYIGAARLGHWVQTVYQLAEEDVGRRRVEGREMEASVGEAVREAVMETDGEGDGADGEVFA